MKKPVKKVPSKSTVKPGKEEVKVFIQYSKHPLKSSMIALRDIILKSDRTLTEKIKWNAPSFCYAGDDRITFNLSKADCLQVIWHRGAKSKDRKGKKNLLVDDSGLLEWLSPDRAISRFYSQTDVVKNKTALTKLVKRWVEASKV